ncbi:MAG: hypothetical protein WKF30_02790, partial [Pyrinomonadaceae bacterium]
LFCFLPATSVGQTASANISTADSNTAQKFSKSDPLGAPEEEMRARNNIKVEEKRRSDTLTRVREGAGIAAALHQQFTQQPFLGREEIRQLEKFEKLVKKVLGDVGGDDDDKELTLSNYPSDTNEALQLLSDSAAKLRKEVEATPRQVVSASAINCANELLVIIKLLRRQSQPQR